MSDSAERQVRLQGIRILRLRLKGVDRNYQVDLRTPGQETGRALSVIAGAFSTGKSSVLEFTAYCLGGSNHPQHPEVLRKVRSAQLEVELSGAIHTIERAVGEPSTTAFVRPGGLDAEQPMPLERRVIQPAGDPGSLSSLLLSYCGLEGVELREAPSKAESGTDPLSMRDLMWLCFLPNERLDDKNLLFESSPMKRLKLQQVVDVVFGVHDDKAVEIGRRIKELETRRTRAKSDFAATQAFLDEQQLGGRVEAELIRDQAERAMADVDGALVELDERVLSASEFATELRDQHHAAARRAQRSAALVRDRETQVRRFVPLRAQYADDIAKLTMLSEARRLFDPLQVKVCPACMSAVSTTPVGERCGLCDSAILPNDSGFDVTSELRATKARLAEITQYVDDLDAELPGLRVGAQRAAVEESDLAHAVDLATSEAVSPFLGQRDDLMRQRQTAAAAVERARTTQRMLDSLDRRATAVTRLEDSLKVLRGELELASEQPDRNQIIHRISQRFVDILTAWKYPKLDQAFIDNRLVPHMRGSTYTHASSGGRTLISLAWILALFEIAWEDGGSHPGFLMLDSPQKNLGQAGDRDAEFADTVAVADFYRHVHDWLGGPGQGAQVIVVDNAPPPTADGNVVVRYSRRADDPPYGLIEDEVS